MISKYTELTAFDEVSKVFDGKVYSQELPVKGAILCLWWSEFPGEAMGDQPSLMYCCKTAPTAQSEASAIMQVGACGLGCTSRVASARASLIVLKAVMASSPQLK